MSQTPSVDAPTEQVTDPVGQALRLVPMMRRGPEAHRDAAAVRASALLAAAPTEELAVDLDAVVGVLRLLPERQLLGCYATGDLDLDRRRLWVRCEQRLIQLRER